jgi:nucleoside 2-deoxyribosyltransferase
VTVAPASIYLAGPWERREQLARLARYLERHGHRVTSRWLTQHGEAQDVDEFRRQARNDLADIDAADVLVLDTRVEGSPRGGRHFESGYAFANGTPIILLGLPVNVFHYLGGIAYALSAAELLRMLRNY